MKYYFVAISHRNLILEAMSTLMYAVGTPIPGQLSRRSCVYFRPKRQNDKTFFTFQYGDGCSATVRNYTYYISYFFNNNNFIL
jgi:hypothetical protein